MVSAKRTSPLTGSRSATARTTRKPMPENIPVKPFILNGQPFDAVSDPLSVCSARIRRRDQNQPMSAAVGEPSMHCGRWIGIARRGGFRRAAPHDGDEGHIARNRRSQPTFLAESRAPGYCPVVWWKARRQLARSEPSYWSLIVLVGHEHHVAVRNTRRPRPSGIRLALRSRRIPQGEKEERSEERSQPSLLLPDA